MTNALHVTQLPFTSNLFPFVSAFHLNSVWYLNYMADYNYSTKLCLLIEEEFVMLIRCMHYLLQQVETSGMASQIVMR